ncbi:MAG: PsiF family protein [Steroidobacteraceae bacterium]
MKIVPALAIATLMLGSAAYAATGEAGAATKPAATQHTASSKAASCRAEANSKHLKGQERAKFIKECRANTKT